MNTKISTAKRITSLILTIIMVISMMPMSVFAEDDAAEPNVEQSEARIGSTEYATLAEAFGAAQSGDTVELLKGAELSGADNPKISKNITLDTNGNTVSAENVAVTVKSGGKLTVTNSSGKGRSLDVALYVESGGTLVANAGAKQTLSDVYLASGGGLVCTDGTIGKLTLTGKGTEYNVKLADGNGHSTISGGISCSNDKVTVGDLLKKNHSGLALYAAKKQIKSATPISQIGKSTKLWVGKCTDHKDADPTDGKCDYCGKGMTADNAAATTATTTKGTRKAAKAPRAANVAEVTVGGTATGFDTYDAAVAYANKHSGCTLKLLADVVSPEYEDDNSIPFITGNVTLNLNGKTIDLVDVGAVSYDEKTDETTKGASGTLTVTGDGSIGYLTVNYGTLNLKSGTIEQIEATSFAATVNITGGTAEKLTLSSDKDEKISAAVSGGSVQELNLGEATAVFTDGNHGSKTGRWVISGGTLKISGGKFSTLKFLIVSGDISLTGGEFDYISTDPEMGSSEYKKPTLGSMLGDKCAFYGTDGIMNADVLTLENVKVVAGHDHIYKNGKCTICGAQCNHKGNVNSDDGVCGVCGTQLEAEVKYENGSASYFTSFMSALESIPHNMKETVTVTLLKDSYTVENNLYFQKNNSIKLNLNGNALTGKGKIIVGSHTSLILTNGDIDKELTVEAAGGDITVEDTCGNVGKISVTSAESTVSIKGGNIERLSLDFIDTESLNNIKLSGGKFDTVSFSAKGKVAITDMLEAGYAFKDNKGTLTGKAGELVPYGRTADAATYFAKLEVVKCDHAAVNEAKGYCNYCGKPYAAKVTDKDGNVSYLEELTDWTLILAKNCTVKLLQDADRCNIQRELTFDLNGHHVNTLDLTADGTVTVKGSGSIDNFFLGYNYRDTVHDTTLITVKPTVGTVDVGYFAIKNSTKTKLDGWSFEEIKRYDDLALSDLLADGYAFFDKSSGKPVYLSGKNTDPNVDYYIDRHDHSFTVNADGRNECGCGLICDHDEIGENGKCENCKTQIYFATLTKADGTKTNYESFSDAWMAALENNGSTLKLLCDITLNTVKNGIIAEYGKFTFDLNGKTVSGEITNQVLTVGGTADIVIQNGVLHNAFSVETSGGQMFPSSSNAIVMKGGSVTLNGVTLRGAWREDSTMPTGELQTHALIQYDGTLTIENSTFIGALAVYKQSESINPVTKITSATFHNGLTYAYMSKDKDYDAVRTFWTYGSMLFDEKGKYIDITNDSYWTTEGGEEYGYYITSFFYENMAVVKQHTHIFADGKCISCDYICPHDSGKNYREASYFQKAICSVCHAEYGDFAKDTTAPTGEIKIKERTWWKSLLSTISFGLFYKENVTVEITADDDSYTQAGFDETKHAVKIEYLIATAPLSEETVKNSGFSEYTEPFELPGDDQYVIYAKLTDHAGNVSYASTDGFEIDTIPPVIEGYENGQIAYACMQKTITITDKNIDKVNLDGAEISINKKGQLTILGDSEQHKIVVTDKAGNETTVYITVYTSHDFDTETDICRNCRATAAVKVENGEISDRFANGDELFMALLDEKYKGATATLLDDLTVSKNVDVINDLTLDLNGKKLQGPENGWFGVMSGAVNIRSSNGEGSIAIDLSIRGAETSLTLENGIGDAANILLRDGHLAIHSGRYKRLNSLVGEDEAERIRLYGGSFSAIYLNSAFGNQILGKGCRYDGVNYEDMQKISLSRVSVIPCDHADIIDNVCAGCGMEIFLSVEANGTTKLFDTFESAIRYAEQHDGCTVKLMQDLKLDDATAGSLIIEGYKVELTTGKYTIDLAGKTLDLNIKYCQLIVCGNCDLTISDSAGGGKVISSSGDGFVRTGDSGSNNAKLTVTGGEFTIDLKSFARNALVLKGGSFKYVISDRVTYRSPFIYLSDGYTFAFKNPVDGNSYANEENVKLEYDRSQMLENVSVVPVPLTIDEQPTDLKFYLTSREADKYVKFVVSTIEERWGGQFRMTFEKEDGTVIKEAAASAYENQHISLSAVNFKVSDSGSYRIKFDLKGYVLYSDTFRITVAECDHPGYDEITHKCSQCGCDLAAAVTMDGKTTGYVTFAEALAAAQTDENKNCKLWMLTDVTGKIAVSAGDFFICMNKHTAGSLNVTKTAKLNILDGTVTGAVTVAKTASLSASILTFKGVLNDNGINGNFYNCTFEKGFNARGGNTNINYCTLKDALTVSGNGITVNAGSVSGKITVNNGGLLRFMGNDCKCGEMLVKSGGAVEVYSNDNTFGGTITAQPDSTLTLSGGVYSEIAAQNGAKLTLSGGEFGNITVAGRLLDCLADGAALKDMNTGEIIDGRVAIAGNVKVVSHTHSCVWKTSTHEKLCGCGYVESTDTEAPVISGIEDSGEYYGPTDFTVTDENDFTVWVDGKPITLENGKYTVEPDNKRHTITATDVAGNTVSLSVTFYKIYNVTLPTGVGYTVVGRNTAKHGQVYSFNVQINNGYSKTENYKVLVNGKEPSTMSPGALADSFSVHNVMEDLVITVEGVADITPPKAEIEIAQDKFNSFMNTVTFGRFFKQTLTVTVAANDEGSGIQKVEYLLSETAFTDRDSVDGDWTELALNDDGQASFNIEPNKKAFVYVRVTDKSGNIQVINSDGVVVYTDSEAITGEMAIKKLDEADASFAVKLNGNTVSALYNGNQEIDKASYTVSDNGVITLKNSYLSTLAAGEYTIHVDYNPLGEIFKDGDMPAMTSVKLTVKKAETTIGFFPSTFKKVYDGQKIQTPGFTVSSKGAVTVKYKPADADDLAYSTVIPKDVGKYTLRVSVAETDTNKAATATRDYEILPKEVTIVGTAVENSKVYDGTTDAKITSVGTIDGLIDGDDLKIAAGSAAYDNKNTGIGKAVTFTGFALAGDSAANYTLKSQPESTAATITAKELTITDLKVKNKQYDGKNTAEIDGQPKLVGLVDGDTVQLINGTPTFTSVNVGKDIPISFTAFAIFGDSTTVTNYKLIQPSGITASITRYISDGSEYSVNSNDWISTDFVITAKDGWKLGLTDTENGEWTDTLSASDETADGKLTFYVKNTETGVISDAVTENYKIDKTAPTGEVKLNERTAFQTVLNKISFGLLFNNDVNVKLTANDDASGVKSILYYKSDKVLDDDEIRAVTDWTEDSDFDIEAKDAEKFIVYVRIEDNAGNITFIGSDGATFDTAAPKIVGADNGKTYYVTKKVTVSDENLDKITLNGNETDNIFTLEGDKNETYVIRAADRAGNVTEYTVYMRPISSITDDIEGITVKNVKSSDEETVKAVEKRILDILDTFDDEESTKAEKDKLLDASKKCDDLTKRIDDVAEEISRITDAVGNYDIDTVKSSDKSDIEKLMGDIKALTDGDNLTSDERNALLDASKKCEELVKRIDEVKGEIARITDAVGGYDIKTVKSSDKADIEKLTGDIKALTDGDNLTSDERNALLDASKKCDELVKRIDDVAEEISRITDAVGGYDIDTVKSSDKSDIEKLMGDIKALTDGDNLTSDEREGLLDASSKCEELLKRIDEVKGEIKRITDAVGGYDIDTVKSSDKSDIEKLIDDIDTLLDGTNLTSDERDALDALSAKAKALLDRIKDAKEAAESSDITKVKDITKDNVKLEDKGDLEKAEKAIENALDNFGGNYTDKEREKLEEQLKTIRAALAAIANAEKATEEIGKLPKPEDVTIGDKDEVERVKDIVDALTDNEKNMVGKDAINRIKELEERIKELEDNPFVPTIIAGAGQKWYTNSDKNALFSSNAEFKDFLKVLVDGRELDGSDYIVYSGSTVVELKVSYLKTLSIGEHTLSIVSKSGTATTTFIIVKDPNTTEPDTTKPSGTKPDTTEPDTTKPSGTKPDTTEPGTTKPSGTKPDTTEPGTTKPSGTNPDTTEPGTTKPSGSDPDTTKPSGTNPDTTKPSGTNPDTTKPGGTNPSTSAVGGNTDNNGRNEDSPNTGVGNDLLLWIALLFVSGGVLVGVNVVGKNKKRS